MSNNLVSNEELLSQLKWRYAVKKFDPARKVSAEDWEALEDSLVLSPSSYGLQPWKFYVVTDEAVRKELTPFTWNQPQVEDCSHLVVIAAKKDADKQDVKRYFERVTEVRGTPAETLKLLEERILGSQKMAIENGFINEWSARQCFIALGVLMSVTAVRGIDACPMEGFEPEGYDKVLGIDKDGYFSVVLCAVGYRDEAEDWLSKLEKVRYPKEELIKRI